MNMTKIFLSLLSIALTGCTNIQRAVHMYSSDAPSSQTFKYADGGESIYYSFEVGEESKANAAMFFFGGTGCTSWKTVMPEYVRGVQLNVRVYALNKRHVPDWSLWVFECEPSFHVRNNPAQWTVDYIEFIERQLKEMPIKPKSVILVGVSEGAVQAVRVARMLPSVTHIAIIGSGGYSLRQSLVELKKRGVFSLMLNLV